MADTFATSSDYTAWLAAIKSRIQAAQISAARAVNRDLILLYWDIGREIVEKQHALDWGDAVVNQLASDLRKSFPSVRGFSKQNVWRMRQLYLTYTSPEFLSQAVRELEREGATAFNLGGERGRLKQFWQPGSDEKSLTEFWQQTVAELNRFGILEFLEQSVPDLRGKFPTSKQPSQVPCLIVKRREWNRISPTLVGETECSTSIRTLLHINLLAHKVARFTRARSQHVLQGNRTTNCYLSRDETGKLNPVSLLSTGAWQTADLQTTERRPAPARQKT